MRRARESTARSKCCVSRLRVTAHLVPRTCRRSTGCPSLWSTGKCRCPQSTSIQCNGTKRLDTRARFARGCSAMVVLQRMRSRPSGWRATRIKRAAIGARRLKSSPRQCARHQTSEPQSLRQKKGALRRPFCLRTSRQPLGLQLGVPIQVVEPALMKVVGREQASVTMQFENRWTIRRLLRQHPGNFGHVAAFCEIARRTRGHNVVPTRQATA